MQTLLSQLLPQREAITQKQSPSSQSYGFSSSHVQMWELDNKEGWAPNNSCFWTVVLEKPLESLLDCQEIKPVIPKGNQPWIFIGKTDAEAEAPILWPPDSNSWLIGKDLDAGKDGWQGEKGTTEDEMAGWPRWLNGHEFKQTLGDSEWQGNLACCQSMRLQSWTRLSDWTTEGLLESQLGLSNRLTETCIVRWILGRDATPWGMRELDTIRGSLDFFACTDEGCIAPLSPTLWWSMAIRMRLQHNWKNRTWFVNRGLIITIIWFRDDLLHIGKAQVGCGFYTGAPLLSLSMACHVLPIQTCSSPLWIFAMIALPLKCIASFLPVAASWPPPVASPTVKTRASTPQLCFSKAKAPGAGIGRKGLAAFPAHGSPYRASPHPQHRHSDVCLSADYEIAHGC